MPRIHTRVARKLRMFGSHKKNTKKGARTFKSEEAAKKYAEAKGIKDYKLVDLKEFDPKKNKIKIISSKI
jgi:hypothetical protein